MALNDSLTAPPDTVGEVRKDLNKLFDLLRTQRLSGLSGRAVSDAAERVGTAWASLGERYREARRALQLYEGIAAPLAKVLEAEAEVSEAEAQVPEAEAGDRPFEEHTTIIERGMALRAAALETAERFYETLVPLLGGP